MKHVISAARFSGVELSEDQLQRLKTYSTWLTTEGLRGGGIGPAEADRVERRHLADSILFASQFSHEIGEVWDLGSGVGLPGIPLAIALPTVQFRLVDRSGRRAQLLRRILRILDLANCVVIEGEVSRLVGRVEVLVARASLDPETMLPVARRHLLPGGVTVLGGSWHRPPDHYGWVTVEIPADVLDQTVWLLIMRHE